MSDNGVDKPWLMLAPTFEGLSGKELKLNASIGLRGFTYGYGCDIAGTVIAGGAGVLRLAVERPQVVEVEARLLESVKQADGSYLVSLEVKSCNTTLLDLISAYEDPEREVILKLKR